MIFDKWSPIKPTKVFNTYWSFCTERQEIFFKKFYGITPPWTNNPVLQKYKFTNVYRSTDRVSQYLIREVIYKGEQSPDELFFRVILFKTFNKIETWKKLLNRIKNISWNEYSYTKYNKVLTELKMKMPIYSGAYIMPTGGKLLRQKYKHRNHLKLIEMMMKDNVPARISDAKSLQHVFSILRHYPMIGDFLAYQYSIDLNYSTLIDFSEMSFVVPGPGAKSGIRKCFLDTAGLNDIDIIKKVTDEQENEFQRLGLNFETLWGRPLQLIDCQNIFCEVDKYARIIHPEISGFPNRKKIKQIYKAKSEKIEYFFPPKWGINEKIKDGALGKHGE